MNLKKILTTQSILPDLKADTKRGIIEEMVHVIGDTGGLIDQTSAIQAVWVREERMSTGIQNGIAIPHGRTDAVDQLVAAVGIHRTGVDFDAMDQKPSQIFVLTLSPENRTGPHIQFLAEISKVLSRPEMCNHLLQATTADEVLHLLTEPS